MELTASQQYFVDRAYMCMTIMFYFITIPTWWNKNNKLAYCCLSYIWLSDYPYIFLLIETCDPLAFVMVLANGNQVLNDNAGLCTDGTHSAPEAVVMQTCKAPAPSTWTAGPKVNRQKLPFECTSGFTSLNHPGVYMYTLYLWEGGWGWGLTQAYVWIKQKSGLCNGAYCTERDTSDWGLPGRARTDDYNDDALPFNL